MCRALFVYLHLKRLCFIGNFFDVNAIVGWQMRKSDKLTDNTQYTNCIPLILGMGFSTHRISKLTTDPKGSEGYFVFMKCNLNLV